MLSFWHQLMVEIKMCIVRFCERKHRDHKTFKPFSLDDAGVTKNKYEITWQTTICGAIAMYMSWHNHCLIVALNHPSNITTDTHFFLLFRFSVWKKNIRKRENSFPQLNRLISLRAPAQEKKKIGLNRKIARVETRLWFQVAILYSLAFLPEKMV